MGRVLVPTSVLRRRIPARVAPFGGGAHRCHRPVVGRDLGRRGARAGRAGHGSGLGAARPPEIGVALLLDPPFEGEGPDPGYIAAYPPGVRENGGQYTHAATWLLRALAQMGQGERVGELLRLLLPTRHGGTPEGACPLPRGALRAGRRRLWRRASPRARRVDLVYRIGGVALAGDRGGHLRRESPRGSPPHPPLHSSLVGRVRGSARGGGADRGIRVRNPGGVSTGIRRCLRNGVEVDPERIELAPDGDGVIRSRSRWAGATRRVARSGQPRSRSESD
jgi:hypothetical protein